jgi:hypothetical protein
LATLNVYNQESFELLVPISGYETPGDLYIDEHGDYIVVGVTKDYYSGQEKGLILKINPVGEVIMNKSYAFPDTNCNFFKIIRLDTNYLVLGGIGPDVIGLSSVLICSFDFDFNLQWKKTYKTSNVHVVGGFNAKIDLDGSIIIMGNVLKEVKYLDDDPLHFRFTTSGDSLLMIVETLDYHQMVFDFLIKPDSTGYITFGSGQYPSYPYIDANAAYYDHALYRHKVRETPNDIYWSHTVKWISDTEFFISGSKRISSPPNTNPVVGLMRIDTAFSVIDDVHFAVIPDTSCYPGWIRNFDYLDIDNIFFTWTKNYASTFQAMPSWIMFSKFDSTLNIMHERQYGGDAMYTAWLINATEDGGCIISGIRRDYNQPGSAYDLYFIKTDENGLVTSVEDPSPIQGFDISLSPNPCTNHIWFNSDLVLIEIFNQSGQCLIRMEDYYKNEYLNVKQLPQGIYVFGATDNKGRNATGKFIKF